MSLTNYDYNQMNEILKNFAKQLNGITQAKREVTIPLNEYEEIKRKEKDIKKLQEQMDFINRQYQDILKEKQKEIEHQKEKRENQKVELAILNEKQKEMNKLKNTVSSYYGMFKKEQKENMIKDKEIEQLKEENEKLNKMIDGINKTNYPIIN